jgi:hypothetical protein
MSEIVIGQWIIEATSNGGVDFLSDVIAVGASWDQIKPGIAEEFASDFFRFSSAYKNGMSEKYLENAVMKSNKPGDLLDVITSNVDGYIPNFSDIVGIDIGNVKDSRSPMHSYVYYGPISGFLRNVDKEFYAEERGYVSVFGGSIPTRDPGARVLLLGDQTEIGKIMGDALIETPQRIEAYYKFWEAPHEFIPGEANKNPKVKEYYKEAYESFSSTIGGDFNKIIEYMRKYMDGFKKTPI